MKKPAEKLVLASVALGVVAVGAMFAFQTGTSHQREAAEEAFRRTLPESVAKYIAPEADTPAANPPAAASDGETPQVDTIAAFEAFWPQIRELTKEGSPWLELEKVWSEPPQDTEILAQIHAFVEANQELIDEIKRLAELGGPVCDLDFSKGLEIELFHLAKLREMARVLHVESLALADQRDYAGAAENALLTMELADVLTGEPVLLSQLVRIAMCSIACSTARDALPPGACPPEALGPLLAYAGQAGNRQALADSLSGEGVLQLVNFDQIREDTGGGTFALPPGEVEDEVGALPFAIYFSPLGTPWMNMDEATSIETIARLAEVSALPYYEAQPILAEIEANIEALPATRILSRVSLPAYIRPAEAQARHEALLDLTQLGLLVEQHHAENGAYPESLNAVTGGQPPLDPFTGDPYRYVLTDDGFTLYSVGCNLRDDGGRHGYREGDIVWRGVQTRE